MDYNENRNALYINLDAPVQEVPAARLRRPSSPRMHSESVTTHFRHQGEQGYTHYESYQRTQGPIWTTQVRPVIDIPDRHELFLLADGERKIEMETVTREFTLKRYRYTQTANTS